MGEERVGGGGEGGGGGGEGRRREGGDVQSIVFLGSEDGVVGLEVVLGEPSLVDGRRDIQKRISQGKDNVLDLFSGHFWLCKRGGARHCLLPLVTRGRGGRGRKRGMG